MAARTGETEKWVLMPSAADSDSSPSVRRRFLVKAAQHNRSATELRLQKQLAEDAL
jgi:hypothetical protein